ncbi:hypothetical protein SDC9_183545 [bioreactor metagenome]|uniref:Uncharacterized protein n=1 Tax=bioreactor metagenome TaxID=1076179 RepID=A0A645HBE9_9ZZZZ
MISAYCDMTLRESQSDSSFAADELCAGSDSVITEPPSLIIAVSVLNLVLVLG